MTKPTLISATGPITNNRRCIGIMGTPVASGNRGVLALGAALARLCLTGAREVEIKLFGSHHRAGTVIMRPEGTEVAIPMVHWRLSPRGGFSNHLFVIVMGSLLYRVAPLDLARRRLAQNIPWIAALEKTDIVGDVRGGDSFSDIYGLKRFLMATLPVLSVIWVKGSIVLFPQTYGPFKSRTSHLIARWIVRHASAVIARDRESQHIAQQMALPGQRVFLSPDVAFALHADAMHSAVFDTQTQPQIIPADCVGLNVNGLMFNGGYTGNNMFGLKLDYRRFLTVLTAELLSIHSGPLLLIPHTYAPAGNVESDNAACQALKSSLPAALQRRILIVTGDYDAHQLKGIIARCGFFIGSRMHSCIAALSQGVPCVGVAYSMKFRGVFESVGMADWVVDGRALDTADAVKASLQLYSARVAKQPELVRQASAAKDRLRNIFSRLLQGNLGNE